MTTVSVIVEQPQKSDADLFFTDTIFYKKFRTFFSTIESIVLGDSLKEQVTTGQLFTLKLGPSSPVYFTRILSITKPTQEVKDKNPELADSVKCEVYMRQAEYRRPVIKRVHGELLLAKKYLNISLNLFVVLHLCTQLNLWENIENIIGGNVKPCNLDIFPLLDYTNYLSYTKCIQKALPFRRLPHNLSVPSHEILDQTVLTDNISITQLTLTNFIGFTKNFFNLNSSISYIKIPAELYGGNKMEDANKPDETKDENNKGSQSPLTKVKRKRGRPKQKKEKSGSDTSKTDTNQQTPPDSNPDAPPPATRTLRKRKHGTEPDLQRNIRTKYGNNGRSVPDHDIQSNHSNRSRDELSRARNPPRRSSRIQAQMQVVENSNATISPTNPQTNSVTTNLSIAAPNLITDNANTNNPLTTINNANTAEQTSTISRNNGNNVLTTDNLEQNGGPAQEENLSSISPVVEERRRIKAHKMLSYKSRAKRLLRRWPNEEVFKKEYQEFYMEFQNGIPRVPKMGWKEVDVYKLFRLTLHKGGFDEITRRQLWKEIYKGLNSTNVVSNAATTVRSHYRKLLWDFEIHCMAKNYEEMMKKLADDAAQENTNDGDRRETANCSEAAPQVANSRRDFTMDSIMRQQQEPIVDPSYPVLTEEGPITPPRQQHLPLPKTEDYWRYPLSEYPPPQNVRPTNDSYYHPHPTYQLNHPHYRPPIPDRPPPWPEYDYRHFGNDWDSTYRRHYPNMQHPPYPPYGPSQYPPHYFYHHHHHQYNRHNHQNYGYPHYEAPCPPYNYDNVYGYQGSNHRPLVNPPYFQSNNR